MALISVMSAKGAPGATTTSMLLANLWPAQTLLVDADPLGGDIALRVMGEHGRALDPDYGLMSLLPAARRGLLPEMVAQHAQIALGGQPVVGGLPGPEQATAVAPMWPTLSDVFAGITGSDVVVDVGQVHQRSSHLAVVERSDLLLCVYRPTAWSAIHTRRRLEGLADVLRDFPIRIGLVGVAAAADEGNARTAAARIIGDWDWVTDFGVLAHDPRAAVMFEGATVYRPERSLLARSGRELVGRVYAALADTATPVDATVADPQGNGTPAPDADTPPVEVFTGIGKRRGSRARRSA
jgi:hypothetical protein